MKKLLLVFLVLALISAGTTKLARITTINKSGYDVKIFLTGTELGQFYYLSVPVGTRDNPSEKTWTILPDNYQWKVVYSVQDGSFSVPIGEEYRELLVTGNTKITFLAPAVFYNFCDPDSYRLDQLALNQNCGVNYLQGEKNNMKFVPLGIWYLKNH